MGCSLTPAPQKRRHSAALAYSEVAHPTLRTCDLCPSEGCGLIPEALEHVSAIRHEILPQLIPVEGRLSFGNGCQAIDILGGHFEPFFQIRFEIVE